MATKTLNRRRYTAELLAGYKRGINRVVYSSHPYENFEVEYSPRNKHDAEPWVLATVPADGHSQMGYRFSGRECHLLNWRFQTEARGMEFIILDSVSGWVVSRARSRYAAESTARRFEENPVLAMELTLTKASDIEEGDTIISAGYPKAVVSAYREGDLVWIRTSGGMEHDFHKDEVFTVGTFRKGDVA